MGVCVIRAELSWYEVAIVSRSDVPSLCVCTIGEVGAVPSLVSTVEGAFSNRDSSEHTEDVSDQKQGNSV